MGLIVLKVRRGGGGCNVDGRKMAQFFKKKFKNLRYERANRKIIKSDQNVLLTKLYQVIFYIRNTFIQSSHSSLSV